MQLRDYQSKAIDAAIRSLRNNAKNPCIVAPTGSGKSVIMAFLIRQLIANNPNVKILVLAHVKELVQQNYDKLHQITPDLDIGIYSAGLKRKDNGKNIIFSSIISAWNNIKKDILSSNIGHIDLIIIDEAHRINFKKEGIYRKLISLYKLTCNAKVLGLTATPYRTATGSIISDDGILNLICYNIQIQSLIDQRYIAKPYTIYAKNTFDMQKVTIKNGEFDIKEAAEVMSVIKEPLLQEIQAKTIGRKHIICFCCNIEHANKMCEKLNEIGISSMVLHSKLNNERDKIIDDFKNGKFRCLVNINILTEGFDAPFIDCVILMRATMSPGLYVQMIGRGFRVTPTKQDFLVLDFGENIDRHGCVDDINTQPHKTTKRGQAPVKKCPRCQCATFLASKECPSCKYKYEINKNDKVSPFASISQILAKDAKPLKVGVKTVGYYVHQKPGKPKSLKVVYNTGSFGITQYMEFICLYHDGYAQRKAQDWWFERANEEIPDNIIDAINIAKEFKKPIEITVRKNGKYWDIIDYTFENEVIYTTPMDQLDPNQDIDF